MSPGGLDRSDSGQSPERAIWISDPADRHDLVVFAERARVLDVVEHGPRVLPLTLRLTRDLGAAQHVLTREDRRDGLFLNHRGLGVTF